MLPAPNNETAIACRAVLGKFTAVDDVERELAHIAIQDKHGFNELVPVKKPSMPSSVREFNLMSQREKDKSLASNSRFFGDTGDGGRYYGSINLAISTNAARLEWLNKMKEVFEKENNVQLLNKVTNRIKDFIAVKDEGSDQDREVKEWYNRREE